MQVLHVVSSTDPRQGGVSQAVRAMTAGLTDAGIGNEIVSLDSVQDAHVLTTSCPLHPLGPVSNPWQYSRHLKTWLQEHWSRFDAIIVHGLWLFPSYVAARTVQSVRRSRPGQAPLLFLMPHGMLDPYFQRAPERRLKALRNWLYWYLIEQKTVSEADGMLFTCEEECRLARTTFPRYRPQSERVIGLGTEASPAHTHTQRQAFAAACPQVGSRPYLLFIGRLHPKKGLDMLLSAYEEIAAVNSADRDSLPDLVVAGPDREGIFGESLIQRVAGSRLLRPRVHFPGLLTGHAKWGAFYGCDAFILPSHQENFGIAVAEALACQRPVLISNQVNIWNEIADGSAGFVEPDTLQGTHQLLHRWFSLSPDERVAMSQRARHCFETHFAIPQATTRLIEALSTAT